MSKKIGMYGGSFDPIHLGHVNLAVEIMEARGLDEVWFCPAFMNPHKRERKFAGAAHRLNMLRLATQGMPFFRVIDLELQREGYSYTIDTLHELMSAATDQKNHFSFSLIMGEDAARHFSQWHRAEEIVQLVPLWVGCRSSNIKFTGLSSHSLIDQAVQKGITQTRVMEISSTEIRSRLSKQQFCGHLLQKNVMDYILLNSLYY